MVVDIPGIAVGFEVSLNAPGHRCAGNVQMKVADQWRQPARPRDQRSPAWNAAQQAHSNRPRHHNLPLPWKKKKNALYRLNLGWGSWNNCSLERYIQQQRHCQLPAPTPAWHRLKLRQRPEAPSLMPSGDRMEEQASCRLLRPQPGLRPVDDLGTSWPCIRPWCRLISAMEALEMPAPDCGRDGPAPVGRGKLQTSLS
jgi:hypothetical protein